MAVVKLKGKIPGPRSLTLLEEFRSQVPRGVYTVTPFMMARASGAMVEDVDGNRLLDFAGGLGCLNVGHRADSVIAAARQQLDAFTHACIHVTPYAAYGRLARELNRRTPGDFAKKTMLANSGVEGVENAIKIARAYTGRPAVVCFEDAFHGRSLLGMSLTSRVNPYKSGFGPFAPEIYRLPYAYCFRCSYSLEHPACELHCADQLHNIFSRHVDPDRVAALVVEPVLGEGGFVVPPAGFLERLQEICREQGILLIADEVQTGFGRTGKLFACEHSGLEPDLLVTGKSLAGGFPLSGVTGRMEIMDAPQVGGLGGTFGGNPIACEAALAVLELFDSGELTKRANEIGACFQERAQFWKESHDFVGDVRGLGAMQALEIIKEGRQPNADRTGAILAACHERGLIIISAGTFGNVVRVLVPLSASVEEIEEGLNILGEALNSH